LIAHQAELIVTSYQFYLYIDLVQNISILEEQVGMNASHHIDAMTLLNVIITPNETIVCIITI